MSGSSAIQDDRKRCSITTTTTTTTVPTAATAISGSAAVAPVGAPRADIAEDPARVTVARCIWAASRPALHDQECEYERHSGYQEQAEDHVRLL
jgi:hypothetical protein